MSEAKRTAFCHQPQKGESLLVGGVCPYSCLTNQSPSKTDVKHNMLAHFKWAVDMIRSGNVRKSSAWLRSFL